MSFIKNCNKHCITKGELIMIGIIGAMAIEVDGIAAMMDNMTVETISSMKFYKGTLCGKETVTAQCNPGKVNAAICAQTIIMKYSPDIIINTGVAGGVDEELNICDVAIGTDSVQYDMDTTALGEPLGYISGLNMVRIPCDERISSLLAGCARAANGGGVVKKGTIATADRFLSDPNIKINIRKKFGAIAAEMEGGAIGHTAFANGVPYGILRMISDNADGLSDMDYPAFCKIAAEKSIKICSLFVEKWCD